jgi:predicted Zn-dependent protease
VSALVGVAIALSACAFTAGYVENPITGERQRIRITPQEEMAIGWRAAPQMAARYGGLHPDAQMQARVDEIGRRVVTQSAAATSEYTFNFHLLADAKTMNAFALPGGQVFITYALYTKLGTEGEIASVLAHEIGHVLARHAAERISDSPLSSYLTATVLTSYKSTRSTDDYYGQMVRLADHLVSIQYSQEDETESDRLGVCLLADAGYDPRALIRVMEILARTANEQGWPEFLDTHPSPDNRMGRIYEAIAAEFPTGFPAGLTE